MTLDLNESQLRLALENAPFPVLAYDEAGRVRYINEELLRSTGYRLDQMPTVSVWRELIGVDPAANASHREGEFPVRIADGSQRLWRFRTFPVGDAMTVVMAADVTGQRGAVEALARSETKLRHALRIGGIGSFERDFLGRVTHYSDELMALHGLPEARRRENFESWFARVHPDDRGRVVAYAKALGDADPPHSVEYRVTRLSDGAIRRIAEQSETQCDGAGRAIGCIGLQRDVTENRAAELALVDSEARLRMTLEIGQVGTFDWDLPADRIIWDERVRDIWGVAADAQISTADFYAGLHPDDLERVRAIHARARDPASDGAYEGEYRVVNRRDGRVRSISAHGRVLFEGGRPVRMMGAVLEVTALRDAATVIERDRAELERLVEARTRELAEAQTRLAHAQRMEALGQLAGGIAHDFNNVLQAIEAAADLIERKPDPQNLPRYLRMAREATKRGSAISRRLLSFSRRAELDPEPVEPQRLFEDVAGVLRRTLGDGIRIELDCPPDLPVALADRRQLETALLNLAANAREAMGGDGVLTLRARSESAAEALASRFQAHLKPGQYVRFELTDTGCGMAAEVRARAVEPFFSTKPRGQGVGLGLSMARAFADQSGGALRIDSEPGAGAAIALWAPVARDRPKEPVRAIEGRGRLLLVDDDPLVRELVGEQLRYAGYNVTECAEGRAAIEQLDSGLAVDLLLTDFAMPEMNGVALAREARKRRPELPIVVLTGYASEAAEAAGDADFALLRKPIDREALIGRVAAMIGGG